MRAALRTRVERDDVEELVRAYVAALAAVEDAKATSEHALAASREAQAGADARRAELLALDTPRARKLIAGDHLVTVSQDDVTVEAVERV